MWDSLEKQRLVSKSLLEMLPNRIISVLGIVPGIDAKSVPARGTNVRYADVPGNVADKLDNLYAVGLLTDGVLSEIESDPGNTADATDEVRALFEVSPSFVKALRSSAETRKKVRERFDSLMEKTPVYVNPDGTLDYICIRVERYPYGISYHGAYYKRSGSTIQEMRGAELSTFLLGRSGRSWDGMPVAGLGATDLDRSAIQAYRDKAVESGRHTREEVDVSDIQVITDLRLLDRTQRIPEIVRAAAMMFHPEPEIFAVGAYIKIAYFAPEGAYGSNKSDDIIYHDIVRGPLITQADKAVDMLYTKYLKALVDYEGLQRKETYMTPRDAMREIILNAINHKAYESGNPIQISVYDDHIMVFNQGYWPSDIDTGRVYEWHTSYPHNPVMSGVFFNSGDIEAYGSGFNKIRIACDRYGAPYPSVAATPNGVTVEIRACDRYIKLLKYGRYWDTYPEYDGRGQKDGRSHVMAEKESIIKGSQTWQDKQTERILDHMSDILSSELDEREKQNIMPIYEYLKANETIDAIKAMELTGKSSSTVNRYLRRLIELNVLSREGGSKNTVYRRTVK